MLVKKVIIDKADRLYQMPMDIASYVPSEKRGILRRGDLLDLASFTWPVKFPASEPLTAASLAPASSERLEELKEAIAAWMASHHQIRLNPVREVFVGGSISQMTYVLALATLESGDIAFVPDLGLPTYRQVVIACGADPIGYPVSIRNNWRPDFGKVKSRIGRVARVLFLNTPHNPTGSELSQKEINALVLEASRENTVVVNDAAYQSLSGRLPVSLLSAEGARRVAVELYSFAYNFGLPRLPFGFAVGNREVISGLATAYKLVHCHVPEYYIDLALRAIRQYPTDSLKSARLQFSETASEAMELMRALELEIAGSSSVPYLWARIERRRVSTTLARLLFRRSRILTVPGTAFGEGGQGFLRFSLTTGPKAYTEAVGRVKNRPPFLRREGKS